MGPNPHRPVWLSKLAIDNLRNLRQVSLTEFSQFNLVFGPNGSGKTSLLEAIYLMGLKRPLRGRRQVLITHEQERGEARAWIEEDAPSRQSCVHVSCARGGEMRALVNGRLSTSAELAALLPLLLIDSESAQLVCGRAQLRRRLIDWGAFHMRSAFREEWLMAAHCLRQRNAALRSGASDVELEIWSERFSAAAERVDASRAGYVERLRPVFERVAGDLLPLPIEISYQRGWEEGVSLLEVMERVGERERRQRHTLCGPHRAELVVSVDKRLAADTLSRGQQKLVAAALRIAQGQLLARGSEIRPLYLVDDLCAELDVAHRASFCSALDATGSQAFVTCIEQSELRDALPSKHLRMFHMKHGECRAH